MLTERGVANIQKKNVFFQQPWVFFTVHRIVFRKCIKIHFHTFYATAVKKLL